MAETRLGFDHPETALALNNLGELLHATNRLQEAEPLMRRALAIDEASYGSEHPNVAIRLNNLAVLLRDTARMEEAEPLLRRALAIYEASLGPEHPAVATALNNLADDLKAMTRLEGAEPLLRRALDILEASLGPKHPDVAVTINNLAWVLKDTNRIQEAEALLRRSLLILLSFTDDTGHPHRGLDDVLLTYLPFSMKRGCRMTRRFSASPLWPRQRESARRLSWGRWIWCSREGPEGTRDHGTVFLSSDYQPS